MDFRSVKTFSEGAPIKLTRRDKMSLSQRFSQLLWQMRVHKGQDTSDVDLYHKITRRKKFSIDLRVVDLYGGVWDYPRGSCYEAAIWLAGKQVAPYSLCAGYGNTRACAIRRLAGLLDIPMLKDIK